MIDLERVKLILTEDDCRALLAELDHLRALAGRFSVVLKRVLSRVEYNKLVDPSLYVDSRALKKDFPREKIRASMKAYAKSDEIKEAMEGKMSKHTIEVEIPNGESCQGKKYSEDCPFLGDNGWAPYCWHPYAREGSTGIDNNFRRTEWCIEKYGLEGEAI